MLQVRKELCLGCGLCVENCPRQAIHLVQGQADIDRDRCVPCQICRQVCPRGAIVEMVPVNKVELQTTVADLKQRVDDLLSRIESLQR